MNVGCITYKAGTCQIPLQMRGIALEHYPLGKTSDSDKRYILSMVNTLII
jgi:hypothetical protein